MDTFPLDILMGTLCYILIVGFVYILLFLVGCVAALAPAPRTFMGYLRRIGNIGLFLAILLFVGAFFGALWGEVIWGRLYESTDYCGIDFLPFLPITQGLIDAPFGDEWHGLI